jgi:hypothetical protein
MRPFAALGSFGWAGCGAGRGIRELRAEETLAIAAHREGLAFGDQVHPGGKPRLRMGRRLFEQDQSRARERIVGVVRADRDPAGGTAERGCMIVQEGDGIRVTA